MGVSAASRRRILALHDRGLDPVAIACELLCDWRDVERVLAEADMVELAVEVAEVGGLAVLDARDDGEAESLAERVREMPVVVPVVSRAATDERIADPLTAAVAFAMGPRGRPVPTPAGETDLATGGGDGNRRPQPRRRNAMPELFSPVRGRPQPVAVVVHRRLGPALTVSDSLFRRAIGAPRFDCPSTWGGTPNVAGAAEADS